MMLNTGSPIESRLADKVRLRPIIREFVARLPEQVEALVMAVQQGDHETLAQLAHQIKGTSAMVGYDALSTSAAQLEKIAKTQQLDGTDTVLNEIRSVIDKMVAPELESAALDDASGAAS